MPQSPPGADATAGDKLQSPTALGALTDTGKPGGVVRLPGPGSNALDAGNAGACPAIDQLGLPRQGPCDVGAAELVDPVPQARRVGKRCPRVERGGGPRAGRAVTR